MHSPSRRWPLVHYVLLAMLLVVGKTQAASSILIWPIDPVLEADQQASALWLENRGNEPVNLQVRVFGWSQSEFAEQYQNQRDVIGSPPVARMEPGEKQLVRLTRTREMPVGTEQAYRIIIDEIPAAKRPDTDGQASAAIQFQMRYSIPLFAYGTGLWSKEDLNRPRDPKGVGTPDLSWRKVNEGGRAYLEIRNRGAIHARLTDVKIELGGQYHAVNEGLLGYVLPGATMRWPLPEQLTGGQELQLRINAAPQPQSIKISQ